MDQDTWKENSLTKVVNRSKDKLAKSSDIVARKETATDVITKTPILETK